MCWGKHRFGRCVGSYFCICNKLFLCDARITNHATLEAHFPNLGLEINTHICKPAFFYHKSDNLSPDIQPTQTIKWNQESTFIHCKDVQLRDGNQGNESWDCGIQKIWEKQFHFTNTIMVLLTLYTVPSAKSRPFNVPLHAQWTKMLPWMT
jgi:hypothetical protein